ncbi:MAG: helix-turn-helix transcriptional regulator [Oscillospiraceae bacterium]|nr:helix-turn-helix transcriptional regulator [Oscillospiraceae bacterium]
MEIGIKLKNARLSAKLTQEQAAEALGVSRQTISNWETGKTYPDIVRVVKMSDLYHISLDLLLKDEQLMSGYLDYLQESTDVVKSKRSIAQQMILITYLTIWAISLIVFWFFTSGSDAMGYSLMFLWFLLPVTTFVLSLLIGKNDFWGKWKWSSACFFGVLYMLADYGTFRVKHMAAIDKISAPHYEMILIGAIISLVGLGIGAILHKAKHKDEKGTISS